MNVLIAGAGGVLGRELVRQALSRGDHVAALALRKGELRVIEHPRLRIIEADVTKPEQLAGICKGMEPITYAIPLNVAASVHIVQIKLMKRRQHTTRVQSRQRYKTSTRDKGS